jgi:uncharacterized protein YsxB (DUF464 family)
MLTVTFTESGRKLSLRVKGHAGYAEHGYDIVCASASILAYTLASIVASYDVESTIDLTSGDTTIECLCKDEDTYDEVADAYDTIRVGYKLLARDYPQYVRLNA